jgi:hypothetical protein
VADENLGRSPLFAPDNLYEVGMIECRRSRRIARSVTLAVRRLEIRIKHVGVRD